MADINVIDCDVAIVGAGFGGYTCALDLAKNGLNVVLVEKDKLGGCCVNTGCIPTKTLLDASEFYYNLHQAPNNGIKISSLNATIDWSELMNHKQEVIEKLVSGMNFMISHNKIQLIKGAAKALDRNNLQIGKDIVKTKNIVIATGSLPVKLNLPGFSNARTSKYLLDSTQILSLQSKPSSIIVIGGGVIGIEFATFFMNLGVKVTILEGAPEILPNVDLEVVKEIKRILLTRENLQIITNAKVIGIENQNEVVYELNDETKRLSSEICLEAIGRKAVIDGFENLGLMLDEKGAIKVDDQCETNIENVYAVGDVFGKAMLAHVAQHAGHAAANSILKKSDAIFKGLNEGKAVIPACIYTEPEIAMVGATEETLKNIHANYQKAKFLFAANGRALAVNQPQGFIKMLIEKENKKILGAHIIGPRATELISEIALAMNNDLTVDKVSASIHPHPTIAEVIGDVAELLKN